MNTNGCAPWLPLQPLPPWQRVAVVALPLLALLLSLGSAPLFDRDEGAFSEATREMLARGDFLSTWLDGEPRYDKPILIYWLQALAVLLLGVNEWAFRLPSALAACGWAWAVWAFARPRRCPGHASRDSALRTSTGRRDSWVERQWAWLTPWR